MTTKTFGRKQKKNLAILTFSMICLFTTYVILRNTWKIEYTVCGQNRISRLNEACDVYDRDTYADAASISRGQSGSRGISKVILQNIFVNDERKIMCCLVAKVACSTWKYMMINSTGNLDSNMKQDKVPVHSRDFMRKMGLHILGDFTENEIDYRLNTYTKFMVVRHPFDRLSSAYREKFGINNTYFHEAYGRRIIKKYRKSATEAEIKSGSDVSFEEFTKYVLDNNPQQFNDHWKRYYDVCDPCRIRYNKIIRLETIQEDTSEILPILGLPSDTLVPTSNMNKRIKKYDIEKGKDLSYIFKGLSEELVNGLRKLYAWDFRLFGYTWNGDTSRATCHNKVSENEICC